MPALKANSPATVGWMKKRKFKGPDGRAKKFSQPRLTMSHNINNKNTPICKNSQSKSMCMAKLHRVTVKQADLNSVGSITIDEALLEASGIQEYQYVNITNLSNAA